MTHRLVAVAKQIRSKVHADIGSDHASLLVSLLNEGRIERAIAVENKQHPFANSIRALEGLSAEVRLGNGLEVIEAGEADSLSICGMGAENMLEILTAFPHRVPARVVLQLYHKPEIIRSWALGTGFHLIEEEMTHGRRAYTILSYQRREGKADADSAYDDVDRETAIMFGPLLLKRDDRRFDELLQKEEAWWNRYDRLEPESSNRVRLIRKAMAIRCISPLPQSSKQPNS